MKAKRGDDLFFSMTYEFLEVFLPSQTGNSQLTVKSYRDALTLFRRYVSQELGISIGRFGFRHCDRDCVLRFMRYLEQRGNVASTRNHRLAVLKSYLWFAADKEVSLESIALSVGKIPQCKSPEPERDVLSEEGMATILSQPPGTRLGVRNQTIMVLLYDSAVRLAEALALKIGDISLESEAPYIRILGKGGKERIVSLSDLTVAHIKRYIALIRNFDMPDTDLLFYTVIRGKAGMMSEGNVERFIQQYADSARESCSDIPKRVYPHMFRRTRATHLYQDGVEMQLLSRIMGHSEVSTTMMYAKPSIRMMREAMEIPVNNYACKEIPEWLNAEAEIAIKFGLR